MADGKWERTKCMVILRNPWNWSRSEIFSFVAHFSLHSPYFGIKSIVTRLCGAYKLDIANMFQCIKKYIFKQIKSVSSFTNSY